MKKKNDNHWTRTEEEFLKNNYGWMTSEELQKKLNRPLRGITVKAFDMGIYKYPPNLRKIIKRRTQTP